LRNTKISREVYVPSGVSCFFEICDRESDGSAIRDLLRAGARGGGFIIERGSRTTATSGSSITKDSVVINGKLDPAARTSLKVINLMREEFDFPPVRINHKVEPPIGSGFGTSGSGAIGVAIAISDIFGLNLTLSKAAGYAHVAEIASLTGLGTVISLASGSGAVGVVTEPGSYSIGRVDAILCRHTDYTLICAVFGAIEKPSILSNETKKSKVNEFGRAAFNAILEDPTPERLLNESRNFVAKAGIGSPNLLKLADKAIALGAVGATQNMIGEAVHCLVEMKKRATFLRSLRKIVPNTNIFESRLCQSGPAIL
jgi:pantoate kinase